MRTSFILLVCVSASSAVSCGDTPTAPSTSITSPSTETFSSMLTVKGTASRSVAAHGRGPISVTLTSTTPAGAVLGLGVGIPRSTGGGCSLTASVNAAAGTPDQLTVIAEPGGYCVQVYDPGTLSEPVAFSLSITHP